jgi:hypothetical protein
VLTATVTAIPDRGSRRSFRRRIVGESNAADSTLCSRRVVNAKLRRGRWQLLVPRLHLRRICRRWLLLFLGRLPPDHLPFTLSYRWCELPGQQAIKRKVATCNPAISKT